MYPLADLGQLDGICMFEIYGLPHPSYLAGGKKSPGQISQFFGSLLREV